jgi:pimeloyl-ACP methyl ester carboxylesterase
VLRSFAGGRFFGDRWGAEETTVLALHGWGRTHRDYAPLFEGGDGSFAAVAIDLPGFGATPPPLEAWGSADYAAALSPLLDELAPPVVVLGHSFGGRVALHLAAREPTRVRALVLTGVPQLFASRSTGRVAPRYRLVRTLRRAGLVSERRLEEARERYGSADYRAASGVMRAVLVRAIGERYDELLATLSLPVELVWGEKDSAAPVDSARRAGELLADAHLTVLPGIGHLVPTEAPGALAAALERLGC